MGLIVVGGVKLQILGKVPQFYLIIIRELPKNNHSVLKNLDILPWCSLFELTTMATIRQETALKKLIKLFEFSLSKRELQNCYKMTCSVSWHISSLKYKDFYRILSLSFLCKNVKLSKFQNKFSSVLILMDTQWRIFLDATNFFAHQLLSDHWQQASSHKAANKKSCTFFICYLTAPWSILNHYQGKASLIWC